MDQRSEARSLYKEVDSRADWAGAGAHGDTPGGELGLLSATHSSRFSSSDHDHRRRSTAMSMAGISCLSQALLDCVILARNRGGNVFSAHN